MSRIDRASRAVAYLVLMSSILGCTSMRPLTISDGYNVRDQVKLGDYVRVTLKDGSEQDFAIESETDDGIGGDGTVVAWSDIQQIEVRQFSGAKTFTLVAAAVGAILIAVSLEDCCGYEGSL